MRRYLLLHTLRLALFILLGALAACSPAPPAFPAPTTLPETEAPAPSLAPTEPSLSPDASSQVPTAERKPSPSPEQAALRVYALTAITLYLGPGEEFPPSTELAAGAAAEVIGSADGDWINVVCPPGSGDSCWVHWEPNRLYLYEGPLLELDIPSPADLPFETVSTNISPDGRWQAEVTRSETVLLAGEEAWYYYVELRVASLESGPTWTPVSEWHAAGLGEEHPPQVFHWSLDGDYLYYTSLFDLHGACVSMNIGESLDRLDLRDGNVAPIQPPRAFRLAAISPDESLVAHLGGQSILDFTGGQVLVVRDLGAAYGESAEGQDFVFWEIPLDIAWPVAVSELAWTPDSRKLRVTAPVLADEVLCNQAAESTWELDVETGVLNTISLFITEPAPTPISPTPTRTPLPGPRTVPTSRPAQISLDKCSSKEAWNRFTDGYYGYSICIPSAAEVSKEAWIEGYSLDDIPLYWQDYSHVEIDRFQFLNMTYPPGLRASIQDPSWFISIVVPESLGGKYVDNFIGGLGVEDGFVWSWTREEVVIGDQAYTATVLRQCESHDPGAKCANWEIYSILLEDGSTLRFGSSPYSTDGRYPEEKAKMLDALRTYRAELKVELYCPHPPPSWLATGMIASLDRAAPADFPVWSAPGINQGSVGTLERGEGVKVLEGPVCNNNMQWWKVRALSGAMEGWAPEGNHWSEFLLPVTGSYECPSGWSQLRVGGRAKVSEDSALPNRVRPEPSASAESIALLEPGTEVRVVEGPVCADGLFFWRVESESIPGGVGWTAEGDGLEYYLERVRSGG